MTHILFCSLKAHIWFFYKAQINISHSSYQPVVMFRILQLFCSAILATEKSIIYPTHLNYVSKIKIRSTCRHVEFLFNHEHNIHCYMPVQHQDFSLKLSILVRICEQARNKPRNIKMYLTGISWVVNQWYIIATMRKCHPHILKDLSILHRTTLAYVFHSVCMEFLLICHTGKQLWLKGSGREKKGRKDFILHDSVWGTGRGRQENARDYLSP